MYLSLFIPLSDNMYVLNNSYIVYTLFVSVLHPLGKGRGQSSEI